MKIIEVYHYDEWEQYECKVPNSGIYTGYINKFLKDKQEVCAFFAEFIYLVLKLYISGIRLADTKHVRR